MHISYPATANRLQGFSCPFQDCRREHALGDCGLDVTLNNIFSAVSVEYEKGRDAALNSDLVTRVSPVGEWEIAGIPSLKDVDSEPTALPGGRLLSTYLLADAGELDYNAEVSYASSQTKKHADLDAAVFTKVKEVAVAEANCDVCYAVFYDAVTTPCGHTFCRMCLQRVLDHASYCPVCRRRLTIQPMNNRAASPANELLRKITATFCSELVELRSQTILREGLRSDNHEFDLAIFVCTLSFPSMPTFLHVFEPRYRLMVRQALEGDRTFGMVMYRSSGDGFAELGTVLRIVNVEFFPDGRSVLETVGVSRFRIIRHQLLDGYTVAKTERVTDISIAEEEQLEAAETAVAADSGRPAENPPATAFPTNRREAETLSTQALMDFATDFVRRMEEQTVAWLTARILSIYGECPSDPALFPWWFANVLPVRDDEKYRLLGTTSVRERLKICCGWILDWESSQW
jgi:Lon protease-like protein